MSRDRLLLAVAVRLAIIAVLMLTAAATLLAGQPAPSHKATVHVPPTFTLTIVNGEG